MMPQPQEQRERLTRERLTEEIGRVVAEVEQLTGLRSRWNGTVTVLDDRTAALFSPEPYSAKKEWSCSITVVTSVAAEDGRWRTLIHEALHSVSIGLTPQSFLLFPYWEEGVVENLQRLYRPILLKRLGLAVTEAAFTATEAEWRYSAPVDALRRIMAELPATGEQEFMERLLRVPLASRKATVFGWGRGAEDFERFKRVYAEASGHLNG